MTEGKKTLEELAQEMDLDLRQIPVSDLVPDPENANEMDDDLYEALIADIRDQGFTQPILVRREGDHYKIIDGEHRWRAVAEVGYANIPAVVIDADDDEATIRSLTMNRFRGKFIPIRLAHVITDLAKRIPEDELRKRLGMNKGEFSDHLRKVELRADVGKRLKAGSEAHPGQASPPLHREQRGRHGHRACDRGSQGWQTGSR
jgi:ParB family chromosome partitioning protein